MVDLKLDSEETIILLKLVEENIHAIHHEISHTERSEYRQMLKTREARLKTILEKIEELEPQPLAA